MPSLFFDSRYAPSGFLIVADGANPYSDNPADAVLIQSDWDFPAVASRCGFVPCDCGATDGTVDCEHKAAAEMIESAYDWLASRDGESFPELSDYFERAEHESG